MDVSETVLPEREIADNAWASPAVLQCFALMDPAVARALIGVRRAELDLFRSSVFASSEDITEDVLQSKTTVDTAAYHQAVVVETNPSKTGDVLPILSLPEYKSRARDIFGDKIRKSVIHRKRKFRKQSVQNVKNVRVYQNKNGQQNATSDNTAVFAAFSKNFVKNSTHQVSVFFFHLFSNACEDRLRKQQRRCLVCDGQN